MAVLDSYWFILLFYPIYHAIFYGLVESCRRYKIAQIILFGLVPMIVTPIMAIYNLASAFGYMKMWSVVVVAWAVYVLRYHRNDVSDKVYKCIMWFIAIFIAINILEAAIWELFAIERTQDMKPFDWNVISAFILIMTIRNPLRMCESKTSLFRTFWYDLGLPWLLAYTIWNFVFAYNYFCQDKVLSSTLHLIVPLYFEIREWPQNRAYALLFWLYLENVPFDGQIPFFKLKDCKETGDPIIYSEIISAISMCCAFLLLFYQISDPFVKWDQYVPNISYVFRKKEVEHVIDVEISKIEKVVSTDSQSQIIDQGEAEEVDDDDDDNYSLVEFMVLHLTELYRNYRLENK